METSTTCVVATLDESTCATLCEHVGTTQRRLRIAGERLGEFLRLLAQLRSSERGDASACCPDSVATTDTAAGSRSELWSALVYQLPAAKRKLQTVMHTLDDMERLIAAGRPSCAAATAATASGSTATASSTPYSASSTAAAASSLAPGARHGVSSSVVEHILDTVGRRLCTRKDVREVLLLYHGDEVKATEALRGLVPTARARRGAAGCTAAVGFGSTQPQEELLPSSHPPSTTKKIQVDDVESEPSRKRACRETTTSVGDGEL